MQTSRSWIISSIDFYIESIPADDDPEEDEEESDGEVSNLGTDFMKLWATAVICGIADSEWQNMTIPKIRALNKARREREKFEVIMHGGEIKKKPKKAVYLSDLGYYPKH